MCNTKFVTFPSRALVPMAPRRSYRCFIVLNLARNQNCCFSMNSMQIATLSLLKNSFVTLVNPIRVSLCPLPTIRACLRTASCVQIASTALRGWGNLGNYRALRIGSYALPIILKSCIAMGSSTCDGPFFTAQDSPDRRGEKGEPRPLGRFLELLNKIVTTRSSRFARIFMSS